MGKFEVGDLVGVKGRYGVGRVKLVSSHRSGYQYKIHWINSGVPESEWIESKAVWWRDDELELAPSAPKQSTANPFLETKTVPTCGVFIGEKASEFYVTPNGVSLVRLNSEGDSFTKTDLFELSQYLKEVAEVM